jgi:hypothetical protein
MKYVAIVDKSGKQIEVHQIDNGVIEYAARITAESHNQEFPDDVWTVEVTDDEAEAESHKGEI